MSSPRPVDVLAQQLAPHRATTAAQFAARWWGAYLYKPIPRHRRDRVDLATLDATPADTWIDRGVLTLEQVHQYVREASDAIAAVLARHDEATIYSEYNGPYLVLGQGFPPTPPGLHPLLFPALTELRVRVDTVVHGCHADGWHFRTRVAYRHGLTRWTVPPDLTATKEKDHDQLRH